MIAKYTNRTTFLFEGIETHFCGSEEVVRESMSVCKADTWPELLQEFVFALRVAGYHPNLETAVEALKQVFPQEDDGCFGPCTGQFGKECDLCNEYDNIGT